LFFGFPFPKKYSLKGAIPEFTNIKVGSSFVTIGAEGTIKCDFSLKKFKNVARMSCDFIKKVSFRYFGELIMLIYLKKNNLQKVVAKHFVNWLIVKNELYSINSFKKQK
jgi:hypothetical protein